MENIEHKYSCVEITRMGQNQLAFCAQIVSDRRTSIYIRPAKPILVLILEERTVSKVVFAFISKTHKLSEKSRA